MKDLSKDGAAITAIPTPFTNGGNVCFRDLEKVIEYQVSAGIDGIVPCGTTGESPTLSHKEHEDVVSATVHMVAGRTLVIAGAGSNNTDEAVSLTKHAKRVGADAVLSVCPYYNKPNPRGMFQHFRAISESADIPIILYNIPSRCVVGLDLDTVLKLRAECPNIIGIKEASGNLLFSWQIRQAIDKDFLILAGDDALTIPIMSVGGNGVVSVLSNVLPDKVIRLVRAYRRGLLAEAKSLDESLAPLVRALFIETNPVPVKTALQMMDIINDKVRLPMVPLLQSSWSTLKREMVGLGIISE
jgi:4-hydroxy-tetrahydrodipicolinate synthase